MSQKERVKKYIYIHAHPLSGYDLYLKQEAQKYWESHIGTRQEFIREFRRSYLD